MDIQDSHEPIEFKLKAQPQIAVTSQGVREKRLHGYFVNSVEHKLRHSLEEDGNTLNTIGELLDKDSIISNKGYTTRQTRRT